MQYEHLQTRLRLNGSGRTGVDGHVLIAIQYKGSSASATVTVASGAITLKHGAAAAEAVDSTVGAAGVVDDATYTTLGAMVDTINLSSNWHAEIVDALRADLSSNVLLARSEYTFSPKNEILGLLADTSAKLDISYRISARRLNWNTNQKGKQSVFVAANSLINTSGGQVTDFLVYDVTTDSGTATLLYEKAGADNTDLAVTIASGLGDLRSQPGHDLLVRVAAANLPDSDAYLDVAGYVLI